MTAPVFVRRWEIVFLFFGDLYSDRAGSSQTPLPRGGHPLHDVILSGVSRALASALFSGGARRSRRICFFLRIERNQEVTFSQKRASG
jgi:hypothetical protein